MEPVVGWSLKLSVVAVVLITFEPMPTKPLLPSCIVVLVPQNSSQVRLPKPES